MKNWFEVKIRYKKNGYGGKEKIVSESYLLDAVSFTEAEKRTFEAMKVNLSSNIGMKIDAIKKSRLVEVFPFDDGEYWFKITVLMILYDEKSGQEQKTKEAYLLMADDIQEGLNRMKHSLDMELVPYVVTAISVSNILDVFPYEGSLEEQLIEKIDIIVDKKKVRIKC